MYKQLIIVNESNRQTKSDYMYIKSFIDHFFKVDQYIRLHPVYMNGKGNYDNRAIRKGSKQKQSFSSKESLMLSTVMI